MKKLFYIVLTIILLVSCSSNSSNYKDTPGENIIYPEYDTDYYYDNSGSFDDQNSTIDPTKMVRTGQFSIETRTFDDDLALLQKDLASFDGIIESSSIEKYNTYQNTRYATYRLRIPVEHFDGFINLLKSHYTIISESTQNKSVADSYYDSESRIKVLLTQQDRLLELMNKAETVEEIVYIQEQLMRVEQDLEYHQGTLVKLDNQIDYSTITLTIIELKESQGSTQKESFFNQLGRAFSRGLSGFGESIGEFVLYIVEHIFQLILVIILIPIIYKQFSKRKNLPKKKIQTKINCN